MRALFVIALFATPALADRSYFGWLDGTELLAARNALLQTRIGELNALGDTRIRETRLWLGPQIGIVDGLELTLPVEMSWFSATGLEPDFALRRYSAELRYRFTKPTTALAPIARLAVIRDVQRRDVIHVELDATVGYTYDRIYVAGSLGLTGDVNRGGLRLFLRPAIGASCAITDELRAGAELFGEFERDSSTNDWLAAGPSIAWSHGRFWLAATYGFGVKNIDTAPRLVWAVAF